jgi:hypothetical protein
MRNPHPEGWGFVIEIGVDDIGLDKIKEWFPSNREPAVVRRTVTFDWFESSYGLWGAI